MVRTFSQERPLEERDKTLPRNLKYLKCLFRLFISSGIVKPALVCSVAPRLPIVSSYYTVSNLSTIQIWPSSLVPLCNRNTILVPQSVTAGYTITLRMPHHVVLPSQDHRQLLVTIVLPSYRDNTQYHRW